MEFTWKLEDMALRAMNNWDFKHLKNQYTREEKIRMIDTYGEYRYKLVDVFEAKKLFEAEKDTIKHQISKYTGKPTSEFNTNSLKAWCRKHNIPDGGGYSTPTEYHFSFGTSFTLIYMDVNSDSVDDKINALFYDTLCKLRHKEESYFREHDEYFILSKKLQNMEYNGRRPDGIGIGYCSDGHTYIHPVTDDEEYNDAHERDVTVEELRKLVDFYDGLNEVINKYFDEHKIDIKFED